jgi:K+-transporting ATPase ATPase A chain
MEGKEVRFGIAELDAVGRRHDGRIERFRQRDARLVHAARWPRADVADAARRSRLRRRRLSGLYGMLMFAIVAVFIAGLMVGRTPEYLGKKIEAYEMKMASLVLLIPCVVVLLGTAIASVLPEAASKVGNPGPHGFSEILYAFTSAGNNNGSAFGGLSANNPFYNFTLGAAMWISRYWLMIPVLAIAGSLAAKRAVAETSGTLPTHTPLFISMLVGVVLLIGALTFVPALALGPVVEHLQMIGR